MKVKRVLGSKNRGVLESCGGAETGGSPNSEIRIPNQFE